MVVSRKLGELGTRQVLEVCRLTCTLHQSGTDFLKARRKALRRVAETFDVGRSVINDALVRRLDLSEIEQFDRLLRAWVEDGDRDLYRLVRNRCPYRLRGEVKRQLGSPPAKSRFRTLRFPIPMTTVSLVDKAAAMANLPLQVWLLRTVLSTAKEELAPLFDDGLSGGRK